MNDKECVEMLFAFAFGPIADQDVEALDALEAESKAEEDTVTAQVVEGTIRSVLAVEEWRESAMEAMHMWTLKLTPEEGVNYERVQKDAILAGHKTRLRTAIGERFRSRDLAIAACRTSFAARREALVDEGVVARQAARSRAEAFFEEWKKALEWSEA